MNFFAGLWLVILYCQDKMPALFMDLIHDCGLGTDGIDRYGASADIQ